MAALLDSANGVENPIVSVGVEVDGAGNLDDVVLYRMRPPNTYTQVKYTVDSSTPANLAYLSAPSSSGGRSILAKVADTWRQLTSSGEPVQLAIVSNRQTDPSDALLAARDSRTRRLLPRAAGTTGRVKHARAAWATAAGLSEEELLRLLAVLDLDLGRDVGHLSDEARYAMAAVGLRGDESGLNAGIDWVARQVVAGRRRLDLADIQEEITTEALRIEDTRTIVSIATLLPDPLADHAAHAIDWVDRFDGDSPYVKRHPKPPATWAELQRDIEAIPSHLPRRHEGDSHGEHPARPRLRRRGGTSDGHGFRRRYRAARRPLAVRRTIATADRSQRDRACGWPGRRPRRRRRDR